MVEVLLIALLLTVSVGVAILVVRVVFPARASRRATEAATAARLQAEIDHLREENERLDRERLEILTHANAEAEGKVARIRAEAEAEADSIRRQAQLEATQSALASLKEAEHEAAELGERARELMAEVERRETRLVEREERADADQHRQEQRERDLAAAQDQLTSKEDDLQKAADEQRAELERIAGLSHDDARAELLQAVETQSRREAAIIARDIEDEARRDGDRRARKIVVDVLGRVASDQTSESVVSVLQLPSDDMKGRIIGREGRNIRAFESATGVNLIIDDTPEAVLLSCFDPVRREIARVALEKLVEDGRIHPHRIEETVEQSKEEVEARCRRAAEEAMVDVGISDLHPEMVAVLGRLKYRTSYGQNVLKHLVETAHIAGLMAAELHMDPHLVTRAAFLHDIGKALTHEAEGSHATVGAELARRYGEDEAVAHAIEAHHNEVAPATIEAVLTQAADACSGGRPGARRESLELYIKRLERIEEIAHEKEGVDKVFAMQAGREVRVMVKPEAVDDLASQLLARDIAKQIEEELTYPGQIRVTVIRESRASEVAR